MAIRELAIGSGLKEFVPTHSKGTSFKAFNSVVNTILVQRTYEYGE